MATGKIISRGTLRHPYLIVWVGALLLLAVVQLSHLEDKVTFFVIIASFAVLLSLAIKINRWEWNLVSEVYDRGDYLVVKYRGEEEIVPISNITNGVFTNRGGRGSGPPRITLWLAPPGKFGKSITFTSDDKVAEDLEARVRKSRSRSAP
jgi:hypothetical protein